MAQDSVYGGERYPLSNSQTNIWNLEKTHQGTSINVICESIRIRGTFDVALVQKCLNNIVESDACLRARITTVDGEPMQYEAPFIETQYPVYDFTTTNESGIQYWEEIVTREPMALLDSSLCQFSILKLGEHEGGLLIKTHHIISDGWSQVLLINRIANVYLSLVSGERVQLTPSPSYRLHVENEKEYLESQGFIRDREYWKDCMAKEAQPASLKAYPGAMISPVGRRKTFELPQMLSQSILAFCNQYRVAPFALYYMALAIYLKRIGGADCFRIGVPIFNRVNLTDRETSGMFVSTLPFTGMVDENWCLSEFAEHLTEDWYDMLRHQRFPLPEILRLHNESWEAEGGKAFNIALSFQGSRIYQNQNAEVLFSGQWHYSGYQSEQLCIHLSNMENERRFSVNYDYLTQIFSETEIENFHSYIFTILSEALANPQRPIWQLHILNAEETEKILFRFNRVEPARTGMNVAEAFRTSAQRNAEKVALIHAGTRTSYRELAQRADGVSFALSRCALPPKGVVGILLPRSVELLSAMIGATQAGYAWMILSEQWPKRRIEQIMEDSGACALIASGENADGIFIDVPILDIGGISRPDDPFEAVSVNPSELAYVVYTSGSTGKPKGVEIEQRGLVNLAHALAPLYGRDAVLSVFNVCFDAFLVDSVCALINGRTLVFPDEEDLENGARLAGLIKRYAVGFINMSPSRLMAFCKERSFLSSMGRLETVLCGGEHFPSELLTLLKRHTKAKIYNIYGPSETTVAVSCAQLNDAARISIGPPLPGCRLYVLDEHRQPLPAGVYGELYVGGICVGRGYRNDEAQTVKAYVDNPFEFGERMYKTGDVAAWTQEGEILLRGRKDEQVKLRGLRIEPREIEARIAAHDAVDSVIVRVVEIAGEQTLVAYYTSKKPVSEGALLSFAATYLPSYMIPSCFVHLDKVPMTPNDKIDYAMLPRPALAQDTVAPSTPTQKRIVEIFRKVLGNNEISASTDYFQIGGNSLNALETLSLLEEEFGTRLRTADLWACRNAIRLEEQLMESHTPMTSRPVIGPAPELADYPLTSTQQGIYVQSMQDPTGVAYNMPGALRIGGKLDVGRLDGALKSLISSLPILRTSFHMRAEGLRQSIAKSVLFDLETIEAENMEQATEHFVRPFDLSQAPLFRAAIWHESVNADVLFLDMHHIISDGLSAPLLMGYANALYNGVRPEFPPIDFKDYAYWESLKDGAHPQSPYWEKEMAGLGDALELPLDHVRPKRFDFAGDTVTIDIPVDLQQNIDAYAKKISITPFMLFIGAFGILLHKISGSEDFLVGTPVAGRPMPELLQVVGSFIQTLPLRLRPKSDLPVSAYLEAVRQSVLGLLDNAQIPLERIISMAGIDRELDRSTLYSAMLTMRPMDDSKLQFGEYPTEGVHLKNKTSKLDLSAEVYSSDGAYGVRFEYAASLFERSTIELYGRSYLAVLESVVSEREQTIAQINAVSVGDQIELYENRNHLRSPYLDLPIDRMIGQRASQTPQAPAMIFHGKTTTYRELMDRAGHIAGRLAASGAKQGDIIAFALPRGVDMIAAMIGILQLGCAYMPILSAYPHNRLRAMARIAGASLVLCDEENAKALPSDWPCRIVPLEGETVPAGSISNRTTDDLMYVLFTSGSTGQPKGVMLQHRALANHVGSLSRILDWTKGNVLCTTNVVFDVFFTETLLVLCCGRCIVMADEEQMMLPWKIAELIEQYGVGAMQLTPSRLQMCVGNDAFAKAASKLSMMMLVGEALSVPLKDKLRSCGNGNLCIINFYGPTEAAVYALFADVTECSDMIIGKPLRNYRAYVLDEQLRPVMPTAAGELYLAGESLAKGYIGRGDLTDAAFVPDPWFAGQKMYKTGDIVRMLADGNYVFLGRKDSQIKLNGHRVELDEISQRAIATGLVKEAAILAYAVADATALRLFAVPGEEGFRDETKLIELLKADLPDYMIPAEVVFLREMPRTPSGKTDLKALQSRAQSDGDRTGDGFDANENTDLKPMEKTGMVRGPRNVSGGGPKREEPVQMTDERKQEPRILERKGTILHGPSLPLQDNTGLEQANAPDEDRVIALWKQVLNRETIDETVSFFKQGGTSLGALHLLSLYFNQGWTMTLAQFYENQTMEKQLRLMCGRNEKIKSEPDPELLAISRKLESAVATRSVVAAEQRAILLTGATGYLGAHLLKQFIDAGTQVVCTVRNGDAAKLWDTMNYYFGRKWLMEHFRNIAAVSGDVRQTSLGIDCAYHARTLSRVGTIVHAAADVRHYAVDDGHVKTNVDGTAHAVDLAKAWGIPLVQISTISVSGEYLVDEPSKIMTFDESCRDIGQNWRDNVYVKTKFMAENLVFDAMEQGLQAKIFRVGRLVGRSSDGLFTRAANGNTFYDFIVALRQMQMIPFAFSQADIEMTPVDECAKAIALLMDGKDPVYHVFNPHTVTLRSLMRELGIRATEGDEAQVRRHITGRLNTANSKEIFALVEVYNRLLTQSIHIKQTCEKTLDELSDRGFIWQKPDVGVVLSCFTKQADLVQKGGD